MDDERIIVFDTTLAEGEWAPGCSLSLDEKLRMARQLEHLGVDIIEAGFPMSSPEDFEAVRRIARAVESTAVTARCYTGEAEVARVWEAIQEARKPRIHIIVALTEGPPASGTERTRARSLDEVVQTIRYAKSLCPDVQLTLKSACRYNAEFLGRAAAALSAAGVTVFTLADTNGYCTPGEYGAMFGAVKEKLGPGSTMVLSAHCHNDLGLALANALAAVQNGARQVECTLNGIGERVGITPLEELVMLLKSRQKTLGISTKINAEEIYRSSRLLSSLTGMVIQRNKAIVGANAFAHNLGQTGEDGPGHLAYEVMTPQSIGIRHSTAILGRHADRQSLEARYRELGCEPTGEEIDRAFMLFSKAMEQKREVFDEDLLAFLETSTRDLEESYHLEGVQVHSGTMLRPTATVELRKSDSRFVDSATGDGPVDAAYKAIERITGVTGNLTDYLIKSVGLGRDGFAEVFVRVEFNAVVYHGRGMSTDVITGSVLAYLEALNRSLAAATRRTP